MTFDNFSFSKSIYNVLCIIVYTWFWSLGGLRETTDAFEPFTLRVFERRPSMTSFISTRILYQIDHEYTVHKTLHLRINHAVNWYDVIG